MPQTGPFTEAIAVAIAVDTASVKVQTEGVAVDCAADIVCAAARELLNEKQRQSRTNERERVGSEPARMHDELLEGITHP